MTHVFEQILTFFGFWILSFGFLIFGFSKGILFLDF